MVVCASGRLADRLLSLSSDVSRGNGYVLADGPCLDLPWSDESKDVTKVMESCLSALEEFIASTARRLAVHELDAPPLSDPPDPDRR